MIAEIGLFSLIAALVLYSTGSIAIIAKREGAVLGRASNASFLAISFSLLLLICAYATSDFSLLTVAQNSHSAKPFIYKITGAWGNHEGSMLLWVWVLAAYGWMFSRFSSVDALTKQYALFTQSLIAIGFLLFILFTSNPFATIYPPPIEGDDLNPLLQDIGLALHPPMLYMGYVGFSMIFSMAIAALITGNMDKRWAVAAQPWITTAWCFLTLGIGLGGWWAYRELGWGGWWFWDPVENASLMPWLCATALLHSNLMLKNRGTLPHWTLLLAILTFSLSLLGTFLVRSGIVTSVHSFASDPTRGSFILAFMIAVVGGALLLYALRGSKIPSQAIDSLLSREGGILGNNLFLITGCATVLIATLYPMAMEWLDLRRVSIAAPYFNTIFLPMMVPLLLIMGLATALSWKQTAVNRLGHFALRLFVVSSILGVIAAYLSDAEKMVMAGGIALAAWVMLGTLASLYKRLTPFHEMRTRLRNLGSDYIGMVIAHLGVGLLVIGITCSSLGKIEEHYLASAGDHLIIKDFTIEFIKEANTPQDNFLSTAAHFRVSRGSHEVAILLPEIRYYPVRKSQTTEAAIYSTPLYDFYLVIGDKEPQTGKRAVRAYYNPMMGWLWCGFLLIAGGGMISLIQKYKKL